MRDIWQVEEGWEGAQPHHLRSGEVQLRSPSAVMGRG